MADSKDKPQKLILHCPYSPGDIVMLTAAVRDLHRCYPGQFLTDVRTRCQELWEHNPHIIPLEETDPAVQSIKCEYPLIHRCDLAPYHCLHGFIDFLNQKLDLAIKPALFHGDIHLSPQERGWYSQVHELTGQDIPFWIVVAGGKYDVSIKWWDHARYQEVVDHFAGRIQFVQIGQVGHHHPKLTGTIDLRGRTDLRQLVRLIHHAQGVLCPVTAAMHLAAAVPTKPEHPPHRPCVVVAGGREPAHWEAYPHHQFIHTNGALPCCLHGGCWKDRVVAMGDGDPRDQKQNRCVSIRGNLPQCMDMIRAEDVIHCIENYYSGGVLSYLDRSQWHWAKKGIRKTMNSPFDDQPLTLSSARQACNDFIRRIERYPGGYQGKGIVICGGGIKYFTNAWVCIRMLREMGNDWPIELWHLGASEMDKPMEQLVEPYNVTCINGQTIRRTHPVRKLWGWPLKAFALLYSSFEEVLFMDADNMAVRDPAYLADSEPYRTTGALFWPDRGQWEKSNVLWKCCGLRRPPGPEFESGQMLIHKRRCWKALRLALWFNEHYDFFYRYIHGDKETFHLAFRKMKTRFSLVSKPVRVVPGAFYQHDSDGNRIFQHRHSSKWEYGSRNRRIPGFRHETKCLQLLTELRELWDGKIRGKLK